MNKISLVRRKDVINQHADYVASKKLIPIFGLLGMKGFTDAKKTMSNGYSLLFNIMYCNLNQCRIFKIAIR